MREVRYDIFSGRSSRDGLWLDVVTGLNAARERMRELAAKEPGPYFVYCNSTREIVASVDTTKASGQSAG